MGLRGHCGNLGMGGHYPLQPEGSAPRCAYVENELAAKRATRATHDTARYLRGSPSARGAARFECLCERGGSGLLCGKGVHPGIVQDPEAAFWHRERSTVEERV